MKVFKRIFEFFSTGKKDSKEDSKSEGMRMMTSESYDHMRDTYIISFDSLWTGGYGQELEAVGNPVSPPRSGGRSRKRRKALQSLRKTVKPIDVVGELKIAPRKFDLIGLEDKITLLKDAQTYISNRGGGTYTKEDVDGMLVLLENRKKYNEHRVYFDSLDTTEQQQIDALLAKYKLVHKSADIFIPEFPAEAIQAMKTFTEVTEKICNKKPKFTVIAGEDLFQKVYQRRDPILLASSPFGLYYYILGAWDKEMLILSEL